jgi:chromosome partitioning protein
MLDSLKSVSMNLGSRLAEGISERTIFREFFPLGLTALDDQKYFSSNRVPTLSHMAARQEMRALIAMLKLPIGENGRRRTEARMQWMRPGRTKSVT